MKNFFLAILTSTGLSSCMVIDFEHEPIKYKCDNRGCEIKTNILICNESNTHCEYIDVPIIEDEPLLG